MRKKIRKAAPGILALLLCLAALAGALAPAASAAETTASVMIAFPRDGDANQTYGEDTWGHPPLELMNGWRADANDRWMVHAQGSFEGQACYCIEPGVFRTLDDRYTGFGEDFWDNYPSELNRTIDPDTIKVLLGRILQYGYRGNVSEDWRSQNEEDAEKLAQYMATQILVWETVVGERDAFFSHVDPGGKDAVRGFVAEGNPLYGRFLAWYDAIVSGVRSHTVIPGFTSRSAGTAGTVDLTWDGSAYSAVLTDENGVLSQFAFSSGTEGITFAVNGNELTVSSRTAPSGEVLVTAEKGQQRSGVLTWSDGITSPSDGIQDVVTYAASVSDPVTAFFRIAVRYGDLRVVKTAEDGAVSGVRFRLSGTSSSGTPVEEYAVTDASGTALFSGVPAGTGYTVEETDVPDRYAAPEAVTGVSVEPDRVTELSFGNALKKFRVTVVKTDAGTGTPRGDASLAGAVYGLYRGEELAASYETDGDGRFVTDWFPCGEDWTVREISPPEGYLPDRTAHPVPAGPGLFEAERSEVSLSVADDVITGRISILKHAGSGETGAEAPEAGASFQVFLRSAGSWEDAEEAERDLLVCDEYGYAETKDLPYGVYTVRQISGGEGLERMPDFDVFVAEDGETYRFLLNNAAFRGYLRVVKTDAETGLQIPCAGAEFRILDPQGEPVSMTVTYPEVRVIDVFCTGPDGTLVTPERLPCGRGYSLVEVRAPWGYVLDPEPVLFDVTQEGSDSENGVTAVTVEMADAPQKGVISILKTGEVFASVTRDGELYVPVYEVRGLAGAVFEIRAAEDIMTPDGTLRYAAGEVADTVTTDETGLAMSRELYLGRYEVTEVSAPWGMVLDPEPQTAELTYAGQEAALTETSLSLRNERQRASVSAAKVLESDEAFGTGEDGELSEVLFGLFSDETLTAADGTEIPEGGLLGTASCGENGVAVFGCDVPVGSHLYVREIRTGERYVLSDGRYPVVFPYAGDGVPAVELRANGGSPVRNVLIRGAVRGVKTDGEGTPVPGAVFALFRAEETSFDAERALMTCVSDGDGLFFFAGLPYGDYAVLEMEAPEGFVPDGTPYPVSVREDGELVEIGLENVRFSGAAELTKVDEDYPENRLTGAEFEIWLDLDGDGGFDPGIDVFLGLMEEAETGVYRMDGLRYGGYFAHERTAPEGFLRDDGYYGFRIREDGVTVTVENEAGVGFLDRARTGSVRIVKTSEDGTVQGFTFLVEGTDLCGNRFSGEYVTDENGEIRIDGLRLGTYTVSEAENEASERYVLPEPVTLNVLEGKTTVARFRNILKPEAPFVPKTGDGSRLSLWITAAAASLGGIGAVLLLPALKRKRERKDGSE